MNGTARIDAVGRLVMQISHGIKITSSILMTLLVLSCSTEPVPPKPADQPLTSDRILPPEQPAPNVQPPHQPLPIDYRPQRGVASIYGLQDHGTATHSGEPYDLYAMSAAHPSWSLGTYMRVGYGQRQVVVRINDRNQDGAALRLSYQAAQKLALSSAAVVSFQALRTPAKTLRASAALTPAPRLLNEGLYYVQAGAFNSLQNAQQLEQYLRGELAQTVRILQKDGLYRVHLGPLPNTQARHLLSQLPAYSVENGFLVPAQVR